MDAASATNNVDMSTFLWVAGVLFAVISGLIGLVWKIAWDAIKDLRTKNRELAEKLSNRASSLHQRIDVKGVEFDTRLDKERDECRDRDVVLQAKVDGERKERVKAHNDTTTRIFSDVEKLRDKTGAEIDEVKGTVGDLRETVAGFGSIYVTRKEWIDERKG